MAKRRKQGRPFPGDVVIIRMSDMQEIRIPAHDPRPWGQDGPEVEPEPSETSEPEPWGQDGPEVDDVPCTDVLPEACWDAFIPEDDLEPEPEPGDFWIER